jgi:hypothetical protein
MFERQDGRGERHCGRRIDVLTDDCRLFLIDLLLLGLRGTGRRLEPDAESVEVTGELTPEVTIAKFDRLNILAAGKLPHRSP